ncbi:hypothetical protein A9Q96_16330 [Rhodobacterales bacterium 52_120_T64]|nr:hypothetical protein A9Q96_16330 [Rhodobacterales bacterium 52_120_T64]
MIFHRLILVCLITIGLFSSASGAAFSQGRMAGGQMITICSPDGVHDIILGANGEPVPTEHECADCFFGNLDAHMAPDDMTPLPSDLVLAVLPTTAIFWHPRFISTADARAPPPVV